MCLLLTTFCRLCFTNEKGNWFNNSYNDVPLVRSVLCVVVFWVVVEILKTFLIPPVRSGKCKAAMNREKIQQQNLNICMCFFQCFGMGWMEICKRLHSKSHLEIGWVYPAREGVNSWHLIMSLNPAGTGTIRICFVIVRGTSVFFSGAVWDCGTAPGCRLQRSPKLQPKLVHPEPLQWQGLGTAQPFPSLFLSNPPSINSSSIKYLRFFQKHLSAVDCSYTCALI